MTRLAIATWSSAGKLSSRLSVTVLATALLSFVVPTESAAQDSHYWVNHIGNRARLLGGAVVGNPGDLSAVYYNPGGLALSHRAELVLAGLGVELGSIKGTHPAYPDRQIKYTHTAMAPGMVAGEIPLGEGSRHSFAYSVITLHHSEIKVSADGQPPTGFLLIPDIPDVGFVANHLTINTKLSEYWAGGTWAYQIQPSFGVGVSTFVVVRNQSGLFGDSSQVLATDGSALVAATESDYSYQHWRLVFKLGLAGEIDDWSVGLTVTSAGIGFGGDGRRYVNRTLVGQMPDAEGNPITEISTSAQRNVTTDYRSPLSVAFGVSRQFGSRVIHASGEFFAPVGEYVVLDAQPFQSQTSGETLTTAVVSESDSVFNFALGFEQIFNEGLRAYVGFNTDFSTVTENPAVNLSYSYWDLYHIGGGATFNAMGTDFTLGMTAALGNTVVQHPENRAFPPVGLPDGTDISVQRITLILGFNFGFMN